MHVRSKLKPTVKLLIWLYKVAINLIQALKCPSKKKKQQKANVVHILKAISKY